MRFGRLYKIIRTFLQLGLDKQLPKERVPWYLKLLRACFFWLTDKEPQLTRGEKIRLSLEPLGPVWIKFGQMLSTRRDLLPDDIANELAHLQDNVKPFDGHKAQKLIETALKLNDISDLFSDFDTTPLASASVAQVHTGQLKLEDGKTADVVIKVIRPGVEQQIVADLELMELLAAIVARFLPDGRRLRPIEVIKEYRKTIIDELDLNRESANAITLRRNFEGSPALYVPHVYSDYSCQNVLVMERIYGIPVNDVEALEAQNTDMKLLAERGVEVFFTQVFRDSFFHADMHPGNVFVSRENPQSPQYIGIDCGIVGTLNREDKRYLADNFIAFFNRDYRKVAELHLDSGWVPADTNIEEFEFAIRTVCEPIFAKPLAEISFGNVLVSLFNTARRFNMEVQPQLTLLQKTLLYIEGLGRQLYPQLDLWQTAKPFLENWVKEQIGPNAVAREIKDNLPFWGEKIPQIPDLVFDYLQAGRLDHKTQIKTSAKVEAMQRNGFVGIGLFIAGGTCLIIAALFYINHATDLASVSAVSGAIAWLWGFRKLNVKLEN